MTTVFEGAEQGPSLSPALTAGLRTLSEEAVIPFGCYIRYVLPLDGYVYWLRTQTFTIMGSVHVTAEKQQNEDESPSVNRVVFTTKDDVGFFNEVGPEQILVGEVAGVRFSFSRSGPRYKQSGIWNYFGTAVYPALTSQLVDVGSQLNQSTLVVSNSLPAWLQLVHYDPIWISCGIGNPGITLYPSYAVPPNLSPPYGSVHIEPSQTLGLQASPAFSPRSSQSQLASDRVRITLYGLTNDQAMQFVNIINDYSENTGGFGMMDVFIVRDAKRTQPEMGILAMKKTIEMTVSYNQWVMRDIGRQLILSASAIVMPNPGV